MKAILSVSLVGCVLLTGCGDGDKGAPQATNDTSSSVITAPVDYLGALGKAKQASEKTVDVTSLTKAIQMFQVEQDRLPRSLDELVAMKYIAAIPKAPYKQKIVYDPNAGTVKVVPE